MSGAVAARGEPLLVAEVDPEAYRARARPEHRAFFDRYPGCGAMIAPLRAHGQVIGTLSLARTTTRRAYTADDLALFVDLADRVALAVFNARLYAERDRALAEERRVRTRTAALQSVSAALAGAATVDEAAQVIVREGPLPRVPSSAAWSGSPPMGETWRSWRQRATARSQSSGGASRWTPTPLGDAVRTNVPVLLGSRAARQARYPRLAASPEEIGGGASAALPLLVGGRPFGGLALSFSDERTFDADDQAFLVGLARLAAQALDRARLPDQARAAAQARDEFLSIASHELRTPLTSLKGTAQLLRRLHERGVLDEARLGTYLGRIEAGASRLAMLVNDLLDVSRLYSGQLRLQPAPLDLTSLVQRVVAAHAAQAAERGQWITVEAAPLPATVVADPGRLEQVISHLLDNALKYSPEGEQVRVMLAAEGDGVLLRVQDRGIGLQAGAAALLFRAFGRAPNAVARQIPDLGLGLYISRQIIEQHDGRIWAESAGEGRAPACTCGSRAAAPAPRSSAPATSSPG